MIVRGWETIAGDRSPIAHKSSFSSRGCGHVFAARSVARERYVEPHTKQAREVTGNATATVIEWMQWAHADFPFNPRDPLYAGILLRAQKPQTLLSQIDQSVFDFVRRHGVRCLPRARRHDVRPAAV